MLVFMSVLGVGALLVVFIVVIVKQSNRKKLGDEAFERHKMLVLSYLRKSQKMQAKKIDIMMEHDIPPDYLKEIISSCKSKGNLVDETKETVKLTPFGMEYYDRFIK